MLQVRKGLRELARVTKPGGRVMVGRMNSKEVCTAFLIIDVLDEVYNIFGRSLTKFQRRHWRAIMQHTFPVRSNSIDYKACSVDPRMWLQAKVDSRSFWKVEAQAAGLELLDVKSMSELYDLQQCGDSCMGRLRHCAYFRKLD